MNQAARTLNDWIFPSEAPTHNLAYVIFTVSALVGLYLVGILHWSFFINFGETTSYHDWSEQYWYIGMIREGIMNQTVPYIHEDPYFLSDNFMANLSLHLSPQILFTLVLSPDQYILFDMLLMYSLGFVGCLLIRRRYNLSILPFAFLFLLFNFNGNITSHIAVGHPWLGYFLLPFFVYLVLELIQPQRTSKLTVSILLSVVLVAMVVQGSFHIFAVCALFLVLLGVFNRPLLIPSILILVASGFLGMFRFLPGIFFHADERPSYASGFPTFSTFVDALTTIKAFTYEHPRGAFYNVSWHEHDAFIGYVGVAFIIFFGIYLRFHGLPNLQRLRFQPLDLPILLVFLFSFGFFMDMISDLRIPILSFAEQVPTRMFVLPLVFLTVIGAIRMQEVLPKIGANASLKFLTLAGLLILTHSLAAHSWFWRVSDSTIGTCCWGHPVFRPTDSGDFLYMTAFKVSVIISLLALATLGYLFYRGARRAHLDA